VLHPFLSISFEENRVRVTRQQFFIGAKFLVSPFGILGVDFGKSAQMVSMGLLRINLLGLFSLGDPFLIFFLE